MLELPPSATLDHSSNRPPLLTARRFTALNAWVRGPTIKGRPPQSQVGRQRQLWLASGRLNPLGGPHTRVVQRCRGLLTLFSKGFSSFVCTTCLLSVSVQYLAFAGVHLRICAAISNCTTLRDNKRVGNGAWDLRDVRPLW